MPCADCDRNGDFQHRIFWIVGTEAHEAFGLANLVTADGDPHDLFAWFPLGLSDLQATDGAGEAGDSKGFFAQVFHFYQCFGLAPGSQGQCHDGGFDFQFAADHGGEAGFDLFLDRKVLSTWRIG